MVLGKPKQYTKFEVASFSRYSNIKGQPQILEAPLAQGHTHFVLMGFDDRPWQTPVACQI